MPHTVTVNVSPAAEVVPVPKTVVEEACGVSGDIFSCGVVLVGSPSASTYLTCRFFHGMGQVRWVRF